MFPSVVLCWWVGGWVSAPPECWALSCRRPDFQAKTEAVFARKVLGGELRPKDGCYFEFVGVLSKRRCRKIPKCWGDLHPKDGRSFEFVGVLSKRRCGKICLSVGGDTKSPHTNTRFSKMRFFNEFPHFFQTRYFHPTWVFFHCSVGASFNAGLLLFESWAFYLNVPKCCVGGWVGALYKMSVLPKM